MDAHMFIIILKDPYKCCAVLLLLLIYLNPFIPVSAKTYTSQVDLQVWKG